MRDSQDSAEAPGGVEGAHPEHDWQEIERWARTSAQPRKGTLSAVATPQFVIGVLVSIVLVGGGIHMAQSMTPSEDIIATDATTAGPDAAAPAKSPKGTADTHKAGSSSPASNSQASASPSSTQTRIVVHVVGAVNSPGVFTLPQGARVSDALTAAGGTLRGAQTSDVNLARVLGDGEQVHIPAEGETPRAVHGPSHSNAPGGAERGAERSRRGTAVNVNSASVTELEELPGIGPAIAQRIVEHRDAHGPFSSIEDLTEVSGIGDATVEKLRPEATV